MSWSQTITWTWVQRVRDEDGKWSGAAKQYSATFENRGAMMTDEELREAIQDRIDSTGRWPNGISDLLSEYIGEPFEILPEELRALRIVDAQAEYERIQSREPVSSMTTYRDALGRFTSDPAKAVSSSTIWRDALGRFTAQTPEEWTAEADDAYVDVQEAEMVLSGEHYDDDEYDDFDIDVTAYTESA